ncbi:MAG: A/G-specific adenine glycosylase, partial [Geminicoccaceae bacterium]|nr:A/G-specific adenine glycosylase [Geminicoccaceae bacterium]
EIMLQQTTVATVVPRFERFLRRFPTVRSLASASIDEVLHAWQGLGYYRRARGLHACARRLCDDHASVVPADETVLRTLPGIGAYTAAAVAAIAFDRPTVPVDGNVARVLARLAGVEAPLERSARVLCALAGALARADAEPMTPRHGDKAQALMELGALCCIPRKPTCGVCPWRGCCVAHAGGTQDVLPRRMPRKTRPLRHMVAFLLQRDDGALLFRRRPDEGLLAGLVELPSTPWCAQPPGPDEVALHAPAACRWAALEGAVSHRFTHLELHAVVHRGVPDASATAGMSDDGFWQRMEDLGALALPTLTRKLLRHAGIADHQF